MIKKNIEFWRGKNAGYYEVQRDDKGRFLGKKPFLEFGKFDEESFKSTFNKEMNPENVEQEINNHKRLISRSKSINGLFNKNEKIIETIIDENNPITANNIYKELFSDILVNPKLSGLVINNVHKLNNNFLYRVELYDVYDELLGKFSDNQKDIVSLINDMEEEGISINSYLDYLDKDKNYINSRQEKKGVIKKIKIRVEFRTGMQTSL